MLTKTRKLKRKTLKDCTGNTMLFMNLIYKERSTKFKKFDLKKTLGYVSAN